MVMIGGVDGDQSSKIQSWFFSFFEKKYHFSLLTIYPSLSLDDTYVDDGGGGSGN